MSVHSAHVCAFVALALSVAGCSDLLGYDRFQFESAHGGASVTPSGVANASADAGTTTATAHGALGDPPPASGGTTTTPASDGGAVSEAGAGTPVTPTSDGGYAGLPATDPLGHSQADVCNAWTSGHAVSDAHPWTPGASECDPGTLSQAGVNDTLARIAMFRWMVGLAAVGERVMDRAEYMACGAVASWNPPGGGFSPHNPPPTAKCFTNEGAAGAGSANIGWGGHVPADAIDQYAEDWGNETTFGHRRWLLNPPLGAVGIGFYAGGGPYGSAQCLGVFDFSGSGPSPTWISFPPPGFVPMDVANWTWTFHHQSGAATTMTVTRASDGAALPMTTMPLDAGYGGYGVTAFRPQGWAPAAGETYHVVVDGISGVAPIAYDVKPVTCP